MTDLTEQWKKGELPEGFYYVKDGENMIAEYLDGYFYNNGEPMSSFSGGVDEVLEPVPSYEEWQRLNWYAGEGVETITELKSSLRSAMELYQTENNNCKILAQKLLQIKPELREWLEVNYKEYL